MILTILNLSFTDVIAVVLTPAAVGTVGFIKYLEADKEKHAASIAAEAEKDKRKLDAEIDKEKIKADLEVSRERERSVGGEAVVKIWKEVSGIQAEIKKLVDAQNIDHSNDLIVNEIIKRLQDDVNRLMNVLVDNLTKR